MSLSAIEEFRQAVAAGNAAKAERIYREMADERDLLRLMVDGTGWVPPFDLWDIAIEVQKEALEFSASTRGHRHILGAA